MTAIYTDLFSQRWRWFSSLSFALYQWEAAAGTGTHGQTGLWGGHQCLLVWMEGGNQLLQAPVAAAVNLNAGYLETLLFY